MMLCSAVPHCTFGHMVRLMQATARSVASTAAAQPDSAAGQVAPSDTAKTMSGSEQQEQGRPPSPQIEKPIEVGPAAFPRRTAASCWVNTRYSLHPLLMGANLGDHYTALLHQVMAYEACRDVMEALRAKYSGPLQVSGS